MELSKLKGVGKSKLAALNNAGIFTVFDLLNYLPKKYYDFANYSVFNADNFSKVILVTIIDEPKVIRIKSLNYTTVKVKDENGTVFNAVWYNQPFIKAVLVVGNKYYLYGKNSPKKTNTFVVSLTKDKNKVANNMFAEYKKIDNIGSATFSDLICQILNNFEYNGVLPLNIQNQFKLLSLKDAYTKIHTPKCIEDYNAGKQRLDIEKLVPLAIKNLNQTIYFAGNRKTIYNNIEKSFIDFCGLLKFKLTEDQLKVIKEIIADLSSNRAMNRLLQGEVGSGKTIVSFFCLYLAVKNGYQSALIAPTEILASQHYANLVKTLSNTGIKIVHLHGNMSAYEKRDALRLIKLGDADIVVGTHAVISNNVEFKNLKLAVIDEQHRFGVAQRAKLSAKGENIDVLVMSATPIPRSMALAIYGNLSLSVIAKCPFAKDITTNIITKAKQPDMWQYALEKTQTGSKVFVVCASIEEDEESDQDMSATAVYKKIVNLFGKDNVLLLHGKQSKEIQQKTMDKFANGSANVLVATTIVEVGVDIPEADIIILASPEKFGLATLHQLRGRVGRNGAKSYCFCLANNLTEKSAERLKFFRDHSSGFDIAEYDYKLRGAGDIYGTNQHGIKTDFTVNLSNYDLAMKIAQSDDLSSGDRESLLEIANQTYAKLCQDIVLN